MNILLTGSSGWLGRHLAPRLKADGHVVVGLDVVDGEHTDVVGSVSDRSLVAATMAEHNVTAVVHGGALHKPDIKRYARQAFIDVNVTGTLNLLEESIAQGIDRFVFTSTTSLMISREIRAGIRGGAREAFWIDESLAPLQPRNIYGVTKLAAEHLCRMFAETYRLPMVILRTSRFFPEEDDKAHVIKQGAENTKTNELLYRRLTVADAAQAHVVALGKAPQLGFDTFIISAMPPFKREDAQKLVEDAPSVVRKYFPEYPDVYARLGWTMFDHIDRVYDPSRAAHRMGFVCHTGFAERLAALSAGNQASTLT